MDLAWLRMESPTNPMMITALIRFTGQINYDRLITDLDVTFKRYRRFRQRIVRPDKLFQRPYWDDVPSFRVEDHVERMDLRLPADDMALQELINQKMNTDLDFAHPLWKLTLVNNHTDGSIIIVRVHHCIADGISLMQVLLQLTHAAADTPGAQAPVEPQNRDGHQTQRTPAIIQTASQASSTISAAYPETPVPKTGGKTLYRNPGITDMIAALARILFRSPDPPTILKGPLGWVKKAVGAEPFSLPEIKKIAQYKQATINDVLMAVASGAIRRYMDLHGDNRELTIRAFIMVNLRGQTLDEELGNKFGLVFLNLPINREQSLERLEAVKSGMDRLKASAEYAVTYIILNVLGFMPEWIEHLATRFLDTKGTVVATNVPGPRNQLYLADAPIQSIIGWVPQSGRIGVGLSIISYNNQIVVGLNVDAGLIPDPDKFLELFMEEYQSLLAAVAAETLDS